MIRITDKTKILTIVIMSTLFFTGIYPIVQGDYNTRNISNEQILDDISESVALQNRDTHHTVIGEFGTSTTCSHCPSAAYWLQYVMGDFEYIALVADKNADAYARFVELGGSGVPDVWFDGGYRDVLGHQYSVDNFQNAYDICQGRTVANIDITMWGVWDDDNNEMEVIIIVDNTGSSPYNGHLRVAVAEKTSRWIDYDGDPYKNALLGYAFNQDISVNAGGIWTDSKDWSFSGTTMNNLLLVATVYSGANDYADETYATTPSEGGGSSGPGPKPIVTISNPYENEVISDVITISGVAHHPYGDEKLKWVYLQIDNEEWVEVDGTTSWTYDWDTTTVEDGEHLIKVISSDGSQQSGVFYRSVFVLNNNDPPNTPTEPTGPDFGIAGTIISGFSTSTTDPDNDDVRYGFDWNGDGNIDEWSDYYPSGQSIQMSHAWSEEGSYEVTVKAEDIYGTESDFSSPLIVDIYGSDTPPTIDIIKPEQALYYNNQRIMSFFTTLIIGGIDIKVNASDRESGIDYVEFYINDDLKETDYVEPYNWTWEAASWLKISYTIKIKAYDFSGNSESAEISVIRFN